MWWQYCFATSPTPYPQVTEEAVVVRFSQPIISAQDQHSLDFGNAGSKSPPSNTRSLPPAQLGTLRLASVMSQ